MLQTTAACCPEAILHVDKPASANLSEIVTHKSSSAITFQFSLASWCTLTLRLLMSYIYIYIYMTSDQLVAETSTWQHTALTTDKYPCPRWDSNPRSQQACGHRPLTCWDHGFKSYRGHGYLSVVSVVCCQVEVSVMSWSLVQRSPTDCGASSCVI